MNKRWLTPIVGEGFGFELVESFPWLPGGEIAAAP